VDAFNNVLANRTEAKTWEIFQKIKMEKPNQIALLAHNVSHSLYLNKKPLKEGEREKEKEKEKERH
jgi:hypothetical protein